MVGLLTVLGLLNISTQFNMHSQPTLVTDSIKTLPPIPPLQAVDDTLVARGTKPEIYNILVNDYQYEYKITKLTIIEKPRGTFKTEKRRGVDKVIYRSSDNKEDAFVYQICNEQKECVIGKVIVMKCPPNKPSFPKVKKKMIEGSDSILFSYPNQYLKFGSLPENGTLNIIDSSTAVYKPNENFIGEERINYSVYENQGYCGWIYQGGVNNIIYVIPDNATNKVPVAVTDKVTITTIRSVTIKVLENDYDPDGTLDKRIQSLTMPRNGKVRRNRQTVTYVPKDGFVGTDKMKYEVCDLNGACTTGQIIIEVKKEK